MTRLHEYQGKDILRQFGIAVPKGAAVATPNEARLLAIGIGAPVVIKAQAWVTGRAGQNLIHFAEHARRNRQHRAGSAGAAGG